MKTSLSTASMLALDLLRNRSELAHDAFLRACASSGKRAGMPKRRPPSRWHDPLAWAAWKGFETGMWGANEGTIAGLLLVPEADAADARHVWDVVSDWVIDCRGLLPKTMRKWAEGE